jgi:hypothetical protein
LTSDYAVSRLYAKKCDSYGVNKRIRQLDLGAAEEKVKKTGAEPRFQ